MITISKKEYYEMMREIELLTETVEEVLDYDTTVELVELYKLKLANEGIECNWFSK